MSGTGINALLFLISSLFDFYAIVLLVRLILAWEHADYYYPITQFVVKLTQFIIKPMKKFLPDIKGIETATVLLIIVVEALKYFLISILSFGFPNLIGLIILAIGDALRILFQTLTFAIIIQALLSFIQPQSTAYFLLYKFTYPILRPIQRVIPPIAGIDISPLFAIIILQVLIIVFVTPIKSVGFAMAMG